MDRPDIRQMLTGNAPVVTPVIHVLDVDQALKNLDVLGAAGCPGAFLINHDFDMETFLPILREVRAARPEMWLGVNFLAQPGNVAFSVLGRLADEGHEIQAYWADDARIDERVDHQAEAEEITRIRRESGWDGLYVGGVAFKKQRPVAPDMYARSARIATGYMDVVCTSGIATGQAADLDKIRTFRDAVGDVPLALASGITPDNITKYVRLVDLILVATGINHPGDFYNIDPDRLAVLLANIQTSGGDA